MALGPLGAELPMVGVAAAKRLRPPIEKADRVRDPRQREWSPPVSPSDPDQWIMGGRKNRAPPIGTFQIHSCSGIFAHANDPRGPNRPDKPLLEESRLLLVYPDRLSTPVVAYEKAK